MAGTIKDGIVNLKKIKIGARGSDLVYCYAGGNRPKDLLARVAQLELRLLAVEGQSLEYHHPQVGTFVNT